VAFTALPLFLPQSGVLKCIPVKNHQVKRGISRLGMTSDYIITLKRPAYNGINAVSIILLLIFLSSFFYSLVQRGLHGKDAFLLLVPVIIIGLMIKGFVQRNQENFLVYYRTELFIAALGWFLVPIYAKAKYLGWMYALMAIIERYVKYPDQWAFSKENVVHLLFPRKTYEWVEIDNVIIRDNLFTLDLMNNKIIQKELDVAVDKATEEEFNEWCKAQLHFRELEQ
jgi:hypothetical protein